MYQQLDDIRCSSIPVKGQENDLNDGKNACSHGRDRALSLRTNEDSAYNEKISATGYPNLIENVATEEYLPNRWTHNDNRNHSETTINFHQRTSKSQQMSMTDFGGFFNNHWNTGYTQQSTEIHPASYPPYLYNQAATSINEVSG